jgi:hypothetical protein
MPESLDKPALPKAHPSSVVPPSGSSKRPVSTPPSSAAPRTTIAVGLEALESIADRLASCEENAFICEWLGEIMQAPLPHQLP